MPRKKRLPPKVHAKDGRYYYVDKNKWHGLSRADEGIRELHRRLAIHTGELPSTLAGIFTMYADSKDFLELAESTRKTYAYFLFGILTHRLGHLLPAEVDAGTIAQYLEKRKEEGPAVSGNREKAALASAFEFAMRKGLARVNPCRGVRRNKERPDTYEIPSADLADGMDRAPPHMARVLQFGYITGTRETDIVLMRVAAITPKGIEFTESKTKKPRTIQWTPALRSLVREILEARHEINTRVLKKRGASQPGRVDHDRLFTNRFGKPLTMWAILSCMRRLGVDWTFRQVRPKAQTDAGDRNVLGHTGQMRKRYTRREKLVPVH